MPEEWVRVNSIEYNKHVRLGQGSNATVVYRYLSSRFSFSILIIFGDNLCRSMSIFDFPHSESICIVGSLKRPKYNFGPTKNTAVKKEFRICYSIDSVPWLDLTLRGLLI